MDGISNGIVAIPSSVDFSPVSGGLARTAAREKTSPPAFILSLTLSCLISANLEGQVTTVTATVVDSVTITALPNVDVHLDGVGPVTTTDTRGTLRLPGVGVGTHTLRFVALGYRVREVEVTLEAERTIGLDLGVVALVPLPAHRITLTGTVRDADNNRLRVPASIALNGRAVAVTDDRGGFTARVTAYEGDNGVTVNALGYTTVEQTVPTPAAGQRVAARHPARSVGCRTRTGGRRGRSRDRSTPARVRAETKGGVRPFPDGRRDRRDESDNHHRRAAPRSRRDSEGRSCLGSEHSDHRDQILLPSNT